jgi:cation diffusion facilitator family transporter
MEQAIGGNSRRWGWAIRSRLILWDPRRSPQDLFIQGTRRYHWVGAGLVDAVTRFLLRITAGEQPDLNDQAVRAKVGFLEAWVSIVSNVILAAVKVALGLLLNSISLLADAAHTASDVVTSVIVLVGFKTASLPADDEHPYGHGRVETIATMVIAILLVLVGLEFASSSVRRFFTAEVVKGTYAAALVLAMSGVFKEWLARFSETLGRKIDSSTLVADAWHHRSDAIASVLVAVAIVASIHGYQKVDAVFGLVVSGLIVYTGWALGKGASSMLIGRRADPSVVDRVNDAVSQVPGVQGVHKVNVHDYGAGQVLVSLHIQVDESLPVRKSHEIAAQVKYLLRDTFGLDTTVHVEPFAGSDRITER